MTHSHAKTILLTIDAITQLGVNAIVDEHDLPIIERELKLLGKPFVVEQHCHPLTGEVLHYEIGYDFPPSITE